MIEYSVILNSGFSVFIKAISDLLQLGLFNMHSHNTPAPLPLLLRLLKIAAILIALFFLLSPVVTYLLLLLPDLADYKAYAYVHYLLVIDDQCVDFVRALVPIQFLGYSPARGICVLLAIVASQVLGGLQRYFTPEAIVIHGSTDKAMLEKKHSIVSGIKSRSQLLDVIKDAQSRLDAMQRGNEPPNSAENITKRNNLLIVIAQAQSRLENMERDLAFLSIDVVGSTKMKVGEDRLRIETDFRNYKLFINKEISKGGALTTAWTPDGVMICFPSPDAAVMIAKSIITGLQQFNQNVRTIRAEFHVRCGINSGRVFYDPAIPMEEMSEHIIDVAGHMQKYAETDSIFLSKSTVNRLASGIKEGFRPTNTKVDGFEVYQWRRS